MHVSFISLCEKKSISRTQRILDRYSVRTGPGTWQSMFTVEALDDAFRALKSGASKTTSVACYRNDGRRAMKLLWIVGSRSRFAQDGALAIGETRRKPRPPAPWVRTAALIARTAGLNHDIGKATVRFQAKLRDAIKGSNALGDLIRHEWMSLAIYDEWLEAMNAWETNESASPQPRIHESFPRFNPVWSPTFFAKKGRFGKRTASPINNALDAVRLITLTHHRLFSSENSDDFLPSSTGHFRDHDRYKDQSIDMFRDTYQNATFEPTLEKDLWSLTKRTRKRGEELGADADYWKAIALISRIAVIAADHEVSSRAVTRTPPAKAKGKLFANTSNMSKALNQPLEWHLRRVSEEAGKWVHRISGNEGFSGLSEQTRDLLMRHTGHPDFTWQDTAASALREVSDAGAGTLVFNMAGTGSGKTLANLKLIDALTPSTEPCRVSIGLNLRSLTLQTATSLSEKTGLLDSEVTCLIGDTFHADIGKAFEEFNADNDETAPGDMETVGEGTGEGPEWLDSWADRQTKPSQTRRYLTTPCLVSTIDYLVQAGDPSRQGHHVKAALRVANSDLILDEIDNYDGKALVAIARVVMTSALFGRNVIASSATLTEPVADTIATAYRTGHRLRQALEGVSHETRDLIGPRIAIVDNMLPPLILSGEDFLPQYQARVEHLMEQVAKSPEHRRAYLQPLRQAAPANEVPLEIITDSICTAIEVLHENTGWTDEASGKTVSFGVVRVANIKPCVSIAKTLSQRGYIVNTYHSEDLKGRRWLKERQLDNMLSRGQFADSPIRDPEIRAHIQASESQDVKFVVVATPVEEVGRDHDFDWAVIEPSGVASIVQMAGRVNRHRKVMIEAPNIAILDRNIRSLNRKTACFRYPGNELDYPYEQQAMNHLLRDRPMTHDDGTFPVNAMLQFGYQRIKPRLAIDDESSCWSSIKTGLKGLTGQGRNGLMSLAWTSSNYYREFPLRERNATNLRVRFTLSDDGEWEAEEYQLNSRNQGAWIHSARIQIIQSDHENMWGTPSLDDVEVQFQKIDEPLRDTAFETSLRLADDIHFDAYRGGH